jgi:hypothetical protein
MSRYSALGAIALLLLAALACDDSSEFAEAPSQRSSPSSPSPVSTFASLEGSYALRMELPSRKPPGPPLKTSRKRKCPGDAAPCVLRIVMGRISERDPTDACGLHESVCGEV